MNKIFLSLVTCLTLLVVLVAKVPVVMGQESSAKNSAKAGDLGSYHAILIGIGGYDNFPRLKTPVLDVEELEKVLKSQYGFEDVKLLTDKTSDKPTASNILKVIRDKAQRLSEKDNLLIYYAGHGYQDDLTAAGYWIPINGKAEDTSSWVSHDQIKSLLESNKIKIKNFMLVADSCYSGNLTRSIKIVKEPDEDTRVKRILEMGMKKSREVITSGGNEPVEDGVRGSNHSLFAHYFLKALKDNNSRYMDMGTLLYEKIRPEVTRMGKQTPERSRVLSAVDEEGFFVLTKIGVAEHLKKPDLQSEVAKLKEENAKLLKEAITSKKIASEYETRLAENDVKLKEYKKAQDRLVDIEKKNNDAKKVIENQLAQRENLSSEKIAELEKEVDKIAAMQKQTERDKALLSKKESEIIDSEMKLAKLKDDIDQKEKVRVESQKLLEQREKEIKAKEKAIALLEKQSEQRAKDANEMAKQDEERAKAAARIAKAEFEKAQQAEALFKAKMEQNKELDKTKLELDSKVKEAQNLIKNIKKDTEVAAGVIARENSGDAKGRFVVIDNVVFDKQTNLMWLKDANYTSSGKNYEDAEKYVSSMSLSGFNDWHIPSNDEWRSLVGKNVKGIDNAYPEGHPFQNIVIVGNYWVSSNISGPQGINLGNGSIARLNKKNPGYLWPVRYATPEEIYKIKTQR
ncbi:MAG: caspase family protein [Desulfuromonadaceae bacterium]